MRVRRICHRLLREKGVSKNKVSYINTQKLSVNQTLEHAKSYNLEDVLVLGFDADGELIELHSNMVKKDALWCLEQAKMYVLGVSDYE